MPEERPAATRHVAEQDGAASGWRRSNPWMTWIVYLDRLHRNGIIGLAPRR